jgi:hypothetical protein
VVRFVRERPSRHEEPAETLDVPRDKLGLLALLGGGCSLLWPGGVPRPATLSSSSFVGVGTGIERRRYCSAGMNASGFGKKSSGRPLANVPG